MINTICYYLSDVLIKENVCDIKENSLRSGYILHCIQETYQRRLNLHFKLLISDLNNKHSIISILICYYYYLIAYGLL